MQQPENRLNPKVRTLWWITGGLVAVVVAVGVLVPSFLIPEVEPYRAAAAGVAAAGFLLAAILPPFQFIRWRYEIRDRDLFLSKGALFHQMTVIPFDRIQYVETRQGPFDRLLGLAQLIVYTAAGKAGRVPGLSIPEAEALRDQLSLVAGTSSV